jgi:hypothetical protein
MATLEVTLETKNRDLTVIATVLLGAPAEFDNGEKLKGEHIVRYVAMRCSLYARTRFF